MDIKTNILITKWIGIDSHNKNKDGRTQSFYITMGSFGITAAFSLLFGLFLMEQIERDGKKSIRFQLKYLMHMDTNKKEDKYHFLASHGSKNANRIWADDENMFEGSIINIQSSINPPYQIATIPNIFKLIICAKEDVKTFIVSNNKQS